MKSPSFVTPKEKAEPQEILFKLFNFGAKVGTLCGLLSPSPS